MFDDAAVRRRFNRRAAGFDRASFVYRHTMQGMLERLDVLAVEPTWILDAGAGTGNLDRELERRFPAARIASVDSAIGMLRQATPKRWRNRRHRCAADVRALPFATGSFDLALSNLLLPWLTDLPAAFAQIGRVMAPGAPLLLATLGPDSFRELRTAAAEAGLSDAAAGLPDMHIVGDALLAARFADPVLDVDFLTVEYATADALWHDLRVSASGNVRRDRAAGLTTPRRLARCWEACRATNPDGPFRLTLELVFGHAFAASTPDNAGPGGEIRIDAARITRRR